ncbi:selenocysteine-specific translation elongation factor [candidate division WOR-3 bacterium]|nr:selenocysteine-specific translation elongation factor [candidate division WOR-3 bacterium]
MHVVIGTAGHIDHGKSALVRALTGTDPDRLKEEQERGMTTDLGFAFLGDEITVIDVPGHERFVRHMLAGASTIDLVILVVAADDGVMPQTREHFEICRLMGIRRGLVAINKADLADSDMLELVRLDVAELIGGSFLEDAPVIPVSALTGQGVIELRQAILDLARQVPAKPDRGVFRMPIDRNFVMRGFGTVVAGTVLSGAARVGDRLELLPEVREVRLRGIQKHGRPAESAGLGERAALNLQGIEREAAMRGSVLATPGYYTPTDMFNGWFYYLKDAGRPLRNLTRLKLHIGTAEVMARVLLIDAKELEPGREALVQCRVEEPVVCDWNDHFVLRAFAPQQTVGGGVVLEANPDKERRFDATAIARLKALRTGEAGSVLEQYLVKARFEARSLAQATKDLALADADAGKMLDVLAKTAKVRRLQFESKEYLVHEQAWVDARATVLAVLEKFHKESPFRMGIRRSELRAKAGLSLPVFETLLSGLVAAGQLAIQEDRVRLASHSLKLGPAEQKQFDRVEALYLETGFATPPLPEALAGVEKKLAERVRAALLESGRLVDVGESVVLHRDVVRQAEEMIRGLFSSKSELTASEIRQELGTSRKYLIPLLNYFDSRGLTQRKGEVRILRQRTVTS